MKVLVAVKEVAEVEDDFEVDGTVVDDRFLEYNLNEWDDYAIEEAVQLAEEDGDVEVVSVTVGPDRAEETIRVGLAKGVDRGIRVWDDALESGGYLDVTAKATLLAAVVEQEEPDLILAGVQSDDEANGAVGVALAESIGFAWAAVVTDLDLDREAGTARVRRELEGGVEAVVDLSVPAVLTVQSGINQPRYASLRGIRQAQRKPVETKSLADLGLAEGDVESPIARTALYEPETEAEAELWEGDAEETASALAAFLRESEVVEG